MKGLVIASHGLLAKGMLDAAGIFFSEAEQVKAICLMPDDNLEEFMEAIFKAIGEVDSGDGVVVMCDLLRGSPFNCAIREPSVRFQDSPIEIVTGVNLAMVLEFLSNRDTDDFDLSCVMDAAKTNIVRVKDVIANLGI